MGKPRWTLVFCAWLCACPNDDEAMGRGSPCEAHTERAKRCDAEPPYWGETECLETDWHYVRAQFMDAMIECLETLECDASDDRCEAAGLEAIGITSAMDVQTDTLFQTCRERTQTCSVNDDHCVAALAFTEEGRSKLAECLELECSQLEACLRNPSG